MDPSKCLVLASLSVIGCATAAQPEPDLKLAPNTPPPELPACTASDEVATRDKPSKQEVLRAMNGIRPRIEWCLRHLGGGRADVYVTFAVDGPTGQVTPLELDAVKLVAEEGSRVLVAQKVEAFWPRVSDCVAHAVSHACFAPFEDKLFKVKFPFRVE